MNKTAAMRSQARRAVLVKAAIDPMQVAGALSMAAGGALGGSAVTGDDQSTLKRIGKGTLGAGLAYGGYKLMTDPKWQATASTGIEKAKSLISQLVGQKKAAEAMSTDVADAYVAGFCKAAEAIGVDPTVLYKQALPKWIGRVGGGFKRFGQLLAGGNKEELAAMNNFKGQPLKARMGNWWRTLTGANTKDLMTRAGQGGFSPDAMQAYQDAIAQSRRSTSELRKVVGTRAGTAAGLLGAGGLMLGGGGDEQA